MNSLFKSPTVEVDEGHHNIKHQFDADHVFNKLGHSCTRLMDQCKKKMYAKLYKARISRWTFIMTILIANLLVDIC